MTVTAFKPREPTLQDRMSAAQAEITEIAAQQRRAFMTSLDDLVEQAEALAGADSCQPVGIRELARIEAARLRGVSLSLDALAARNVR